MNDRRETTTECEAVRNLFCSWLDDDLNSEEVDCLKSHLRSCRNCAGEWDVYCRTVHLLKDLQPIEVPERVLAGIQSRIYRPSRWRRILGWVIPTSPRRFQMPALATLALLVIVVSVVRWSPWSTPVDPSIPPPARVTSDTSPSTTLNVEPISTVRDAKLPEAWPGLEEFLAPVRGLEEELEGNLSTKAMLRDDLILDLSGSDDVFNRIKGILREVRGKMFIMGVRNRTTGMIVRSRMVIQVPLEHYQSVLEQIESLGDAYHLFVDRGEVPMAPDRLRIRILAVSSFTQQDQEPAQMVSDGN